MLSRIRSDNHTYGSDHYQPRNATFEKLENEVENKIIRGSQLVKLTNLRERYETIVSESSDILHRLPEDSFLLMVWYTIQFGTHPFVESQS